MSTAQPTTVQNSSSPTCPYQEHPIFSNPKLQKAMSILEKVSLIALAVFAAYMSPKLFFPFFGFGLLLGAYLNWDKNASGHSHHHEDGGCSQGFLEQLTGVQLPPPLGLVANIAITVCHIEHHTHVFAPLIGLNFGMWIGKLAGQNIPPLYRKFTLPKAA